MKPRSTTEIPPLIFDKEGISGSKKFRSQSNKIGWIRSFSDQPGAKFNLTIKDSLGRIRMQKNGCGNDTDQFGELVNLETNIGEELEIVVDNIQNAKTINLFLN